MTGKKNDPKESIAQIEANLGGLFGALGDAISDMVTKLEDGSTGAVERNLSFDTEKGPVRAQAGVRLRMGGLDLGGGSAAPTPVNPDRPKPAAAAEEVRPLAYDVIADPQSWVLTADIPGVSIAELALDQQDQTLLIRTTGARKYAADVPIDRVFALREITSTLHNGILTLTLGQGDRG